jgi:threonine dehydratase
MVTIDGIRDALSLIGPYVHKTPVIYADSLSRLTGAEVYLKCENLQKTGSFKVRGAFCKLLKTKPERVIAASMGNHAQGVAYAAGRLGIKARIVMPVTVSIAKEEAVRAYGAEVYLHGESLMDALDYARGERGYTFIHPFDDEDIIRGQGTLGVEMAVELGDIDYVIVPVGGGGLIAGVSLALKSMRPGTKIIGIQSAAATSAVDSFMEKNAVQRPAGPTLADGIAVGRVGDMALEIILRSVDDMAAVSDSSISRAILLLLERKKLVVEGAGAAPLAFVLENTERFRGKRIVIVISGGNIDFALIDRIIHRGLVEWGRVGAFDVIIDDVPGSLHALTGIICSLRGNILNVAHDRLSGDLPVGKTRVRVVVEVKNKGHLVEIIGAMKSKDIIVEQA